MFGIRKSRSPASGHTIVIGILLGLAAAAELSAHEGPPFPILMDQPAAGLLVSVWADPDIGDAQFFIVVESSAGGPPAKAPQVSMWIEPVSGRLDPVNYQTTPQMLRNQMQFQADPYFDQRDLWTVGFRIATSDGLADELTVCVESTPPGFGPWDLVIYLFPFFFLGGMWVAAMARRRRISHSSLAEATVLPEDSHGDQELAQTAVEREP